MENRLRNPLNPFGVGFYGPTYELGNSDLKPLLFLIWVRD